MLTGRRQDELDPYLAAAGRLGVTRLRRLDDGRLLLAAKRVIEPAGEQRLERLLPRHGLGPAGYEQADRGPRRGGRCQVEFRHDLETDVCLRAGRLRQDQGGGEQGR